MVSGPVVASVRHIALSIHDSLAAAEADWRAFERDAECTVFQTFAWQAAYARTVGPHRGATPAIVVGRDEAGGILLIAPLAVAKVGIARRLTFFGGEIADYNAPLLRRGFAGRVTGATFMAAWHEVVRLLRQRPAWTHDAVLFTKMPETIGAEPNPFLALPVAPNPSSAYQAKLLDDWEVYYRERRSSATRRRDRVKRRRLGEIGDVAAHTAGDARQRAEILSVLFRQKSRSLRRMGAGSLFDRPGYRELFIELATDPETAPAVHVGRLDIGGRIGAANFGMRFRGRHYHVLASYDDDPAVARHGPGAAHLRDLLRHAIDDGCDVFDFTIGDEPYKLEWSDRRTRLYDYRGIVTAQGAVVMIPARLSSQAKRLLKRNPSVWRAALRVRAALGRFRPRAGGAED